MNAPAMTLGDPDLTPAQRNALGVVLNRNAVDVCRAHTNYTNTPSADLFELLFTRNAWTYVEPKDALDGTAETLLTAILHPLGMRAAVDFCDRYDVETVRDELSEVLSPLVPDADHRLTEAFDKLPDEMRFGGCPSEAPRL